MGTDMDTTAPTEGSRIMWGWYRYAAEQEGSVESALGLLRTRFSQTLEEQQQELGATDEQFTRLRGMRLPRAERFSSDAQQIALVCGLANPLAFVRVMLLGRGLLPVTANPAPVPPASARPRDPQAVARPLSAAQDYYMAAFDEEADLNRVPPEQPAPSRSFRVQDLPATGPPGPNEE